MGGQSPDHVRSVLGSYLETLKDCVDEDVEMACAQLMKANNPFVPSAGQVYTSAERFAAKREERANVVRLNASRVEYSEQHRESMKARFVALLNELKSLANFNSQYGKVPKGTKPAKPIVERYVPGSYLERWERENGRAYPARERLITELGNIQFREAAE